MTFVIAFLGFLLVIIAIGGAGSGRAAAPEPAQDDDFIDDGSPASITQLIERDPIGALIQYGDPDTAAMLEEKGIDLGGLGYHPDQ